MPGDNDGDSFLMKNRYCLALRMIEFYKNKPRTGPEDKHQMDICVVLMKNKKDLVNLILVIID